MSDNVSFTSEDIDLLRSVLSAVKKEREDRLTYKLIRDIVPIDVWLNDEYYVGPQGMDIYPFWKKEIIDIFGNNQGKFNEIIVTGGLGTGKSTFGLFLMLRKLYELSCYHNVSTLFNMMAQTIISFAYFSASRKAAEGSGFGQFRNMIDSIPYFRELFARNDKIDSVLQFPEHIEFLYGSTSNAIIGRNVIGCLLDEANFFQQGAQDVTKTTDFSKVGNLYDAIINRCKSRFARGGKDNSLCILISSSTTTSSFTEHRIKQAVGSDNVKIINATLWDVNPKQSFSDEKFNVFLGSEQIEPFVVDTFADLYQITDSMMLVRPTGKDISEAITELPKTVQDRFIKVPIDFKKEFKTSIIHALQDLGGISVNPLGKLFTSKSLYLEACDTDLVHPFTRDEIVVSTGDDVKLSDYISRDYQFKNTDIPRYIHIDQSVTSDSTGFAIAYRDGYVEDDSGRMKPKITIDLQLRINPPKPPKKISIAKVRDFVIWLRDNCGLTISKVTYDQYASQQARQELTEAGINADYLTVDRTDEQYLLFINLLYEKRIKTYRYLPTEKELFDLIHYRERKKIDHPTGGCFTGDTLIQLGNGQKVYIESLVNRQFQTVGFKKGIFPIVPAYKAFKTKETDRLIQITFSDKSVVKCTPEHMFMLDNGDYEEAQFLKSNVKVKSCKEDLYILSVERLLLNSNIPVYDIEVPETSNFALANGAIVHNSKDTTDAIVGAVWNAVMSGENDIARNDDTELTLSFMNDDNDFNDDEDLKRWVLGEDITVI